MVSVKWYVKLLSISFYLLFLFIRKIRFERVLSGPGIFYLAIIPVGIIGGIFNYVGDTSYWMGLVIIISKWLLAGAAFFLLFQSRKMLDETRFYATIQLFFAVNALVSVTDLAMVMIRSGSWIPYWLNHMTVYGISAGDYISGLSRDSSVVNASINAIGVLFFIFRGSLKWALLCTITLLLTTSNFTILMLTAFLLCIILLVKQRQCKRDALICLLCSAGLYCLLSLQNVTYAQKTIAGQLSETYKDGDKQTGTSVKKKKEKQKSFVLPEGSSYRERVKRDLMQLNDHVISLNPPVIDSLTARSAFKNWFNVTYDSCGLARNHTAGKLYALTQTYHFLKDDLHKLTLGAGPGNFSSKMAIKMTGLGLHGGYPVQYIYIHDYFLASHFFIWMYVYAHTEEFHSVMQLPANTYSHIAGEYGMTGLLLLIIFYFFYLLKINGFHLRAFLMAGMIAGFFLIDYWFEMLSLTVIFELLMLSGVQHKTPRETLPAQNQDLL